MSFSGPTAPGPSSRQQRRRILTDLARLILAFLFAAALIALGVAGLTATTEPRSIALLLQPCCLLLFPGYFIESLDQNVYSFSGHSVLWISGAFYFSLALFYLFPKNQRIRS